MTDGGCDYTFDATSNIGVMRVALEVCYKGWGQSIVIGVVVVGQESSMRHELLFFPLSFFLFEPPHYLIFF